MYKRQAEFRWERPVRLAEHVMRLKEGKGFEHHREKSIASPEKQTDDRISMLIGTDLLIRMLDGKIFSDEDLEAIEEGALLLVVPRGKENLPELVQSLKEQRGVVLRVGVLDPEWLPQPLRVLLNLSSTVIRRSV